MTFSPILPMGGYAGWAFLKRTMPAQVKAFDAQASLKRDEAYFREKIGSINTAEELVNDQRLLRVALGAFGLEGDLNSKYFIRKILEDGTLKTDSLANRLANKQYQKFSNAFGFASTAAPRTKLSDFADKILVPYKAQQFAIAVGAQNDDMRLALNAERELPDLAKSSASDTSKWYSILGNAPLRRVFEKAFGLPSSFGAIDIDKQVEVLKERAEAALGSNNLSQFTDPDKIETLVRRFLVRSEVEATTVQMSSGQVALSLLQASTFSYRNV